MILNVSYNDPLIRWKIDEKVGKPFTLKERISRKGIGSPRLVITECSIQIHNFLILDNNRNYCNVEMRPKGILIGFRSLLESYVLVVPYHKLVIYKGKAEEYSMHCDNYFVKIEARSRDKAIHRFMSKLIRTKNENSGTRIEDL